MNRRAFMQTSAAVGVAATASAATLSAAEGKAAELYELKVYTLAPARRPRLDDYLSKALLPTLKRYDLGPVGVFADTAEFAVVLESLADPTRKIEVIKVMREATRLGLKEAKDLVESAPKTVTENISRNDGEALKKKLEEAGARVSIKEADLVKVYVLTVFPSAEALLGLSPRLAGDPVYLEAAADYLKAPASEPVYQRITSSVLRPIEGMPRLQRPETSRPGLLNLRVYESHNERAAKKKIEMFEKAELAIFRRVGLTPVFFAETIVGSAMPNLTYMLAFPDEATRKAAWDRFRVDPEWLKLKAIPEYADKEIVSNITNSILTPTPWSQI